MLVAPEVDNVNLDGAYRHADSLKLCTFPDLRIGKSNAFCFLIPNPYPSPSIRPCTIQQLFDVPR